MVPSDSEAKLPKRLEVLRPAACRQRELMDRLRDELSAEAGKTVQARHRQALADILEAARALVAAATAERAIRGELLDLGFEAPESILPAPRLAAPFILGDESWYDSAIAYYKSSFKNSGSYHEPPSSEAPAGKRCSPRQACSGRACDG